MAGPGAFCDSISQTDFGLDRQSQAAIWAVEERLLAKMERKFAEVRVDIAQSECDLRAEFDGMVRKINMRLNNLDMNIDQIGAESFESRADLLDRVDELGKEAFEVRADTLERFQELEEKMAGLSQEAFDARADSCLASFEEMKETMAGLTQNTSAAMHDVEFLEAQLEQESDVEAQRDLDEAQQDSLQALQDAVRSLSQKQVECCEQDPATSAKLDQKGKTAFEIDMMEQRDTNTSQQGPTLDEYKQLSKLGVAATIPFSSKLNMPAPPCVSTTTKAAHFANTFAAPRPPARMTSSSSMPLLAPLC